MAGRSTSTTSTDAVITDGRRARGERNRDAVVDAILDLLSAGVDRPSGAEIAERAGVSMRSVFRHFDDLEALHAAAVERHLERMAPLFELPDTSGDLAARVAALATRRAELYEAMGPVRRAAIRNRSDSEAIRAGLDRGRRHLKAQLSEVFAGELRPLDARTRRDLLDALEAATSWNLWEQLRTEQGLSVPRATAALARTVHALVAGPASR